MDFNVLKKHKPKIKSYSVVYCVKQSKIEGALKNRLGKPFLSRWPDHLILSEAIEVGVCCKSSIRLISNTPSDTSF